MHGRKSPRRTTFQTGWVLDCGGKAVTECVLREVSATGTRLELPQNVELPKNFTLAVADQITPRSCTTFGSSQSWPAGASTMEEC